MVSVVLCLLLISCWFGRLVGLVYWLLWVSLLMVLVRLTVLLFRCGCYSVVLGWLLFVLCYVSCVLCCLNWYCLRYCCGVRFCLVCYIASLVASRAFSGLLRLLYVCGYL